MYNVYFQPPLVQACFHGDPDEVRALLYKKEDVNYQVCAKVPINPLLHRLFIDHDIDFYFLENIDRTREKFNLSFENFENIMENGAFAPKEQTLHFHNTFKCMMLQRHQKALSWSNG